jgi:hypothetical protein
MDLQISASMKTKENFVTEAWGCKLRGTWIAVASTKLIAGHELADVCSVTDVYGSFGVQGATPINRWECCNCDLAANLFLVVHDQLWVWIFRMRGYSLHLSNWDTLLKYHCRNTINLHIFSETWVPSCGCSLCGCAVCRLSILARGGLCCYIT